jgi:hypothetical protein
MMSALRHDFPAIGLLPIFVSLLTGLASACRIEVRIAVFIFCQNVPGGAFWLPPSAPVAHGANS